MKVVNSRKMNNGILIAVLLALLSTNLFSQSLDQRAENVQNGLNNIFMSADNSYYKGNSVSDNNPYGYGYWVTAHSLETLADAYQRTRNTVYRDRMKSIIAGIRKYNLYAAGTYRNDYYDDLEWLCLATFNCYNATKDPEFLDAVHQIWAEIKTGYTNGAMSWKKGCTTPCKNSIANGPAIIIAVKLYQLEGDATNLQMAKDIHAWMKANVLNDQGGIWDGPDNHNPDWQFSYNSGMFIGACLELSIVTGAQSYIDDGIKASEFMMNYRNYNGGVFFLNEKGQGDGGLFKGIFAKWFTEFVRVGNLTPEQKQRYLKEINYTADYAWANSVNKSSFLVNYDWSALPTGTIDLSTHTSGVHLFESAASLNKVHVYQNINYSGFYSQLTLGTYTLAQLQARGVVDNDITSFTIPVGYTVTVYENDNFGGASKVFTANTGWLADWNDRISSVKIENVSTGIVTAYQDVNFGGYAVGLDLGNYTLAQLQSKGIVDNDITSFKITAGFKVRVYEGDNFTGGTADFTADNGWLADWNDKITSLKIIDIRPYVFTAFQDVSFGGYSSGLDVGDYTLAQLKDKGISDNDITSLKLAEGFKVTVYDGDNFTGAAVDFTATTGWLADWNDKITSLRVRANGDPNVAGVYYLQNRNSGLDADVFGVSTADGANIAQGGFNGGANQQFKFEHLGDGAYKLSAIHSDKVMEVQGLKKDNGANIQQATYSGLLSQQFVAVSTNDGYYKLIAKHSGKVVDVANASLDNNANIQQWDNNNQTSGQWKFVPIVAVNGNGDGLTGNYFQGMNFETAKVARKDATVNFNWGDGSPDASLANDSYSARWTGQVQPRYSGEYTFYINSDNGRRLWVNGQLLIDKWLDDVAENTGKIMLAAGQKYDIKVEYFENIGGANIKLEWSSALQAREVVPTAQLYSNNIPVVSITSPANNVSFIAPAAITINVNATDNVSVAKVDFYNGTTLLGSDNTSPYSFAWNSVSVGNYTITAIAVDNLGAFAISTSIAVSVKQDQTTGSGDGLSGNYFNGMNFEVLRYSGKDAKLNMDWGGGSPNAAVNADQFSARWTGQVQPKYTGEYTFYINSDNGRRVWVNGQLLIDKWIDDWNIEYSGKITLTAGLKYDIKVEYFENNGGAGIQLSWSSASQIKEIIPTSQLYSNPLPTVSVSTSATTAIAPASITLTSTAADADGIAKVDFYNGTTLLGTDATSPYSYAWNNLSIGSYAITALTTDTKGGVALSAAVTVKVNTAAVNQLPTVSLTSPANNVNVNAPASLAITAVASDGDGTISKVDFYSGNILLGSDATSPFNYTWTNVATGTYSITAKATDNEGAVATSDIVTVIVKSVVTDACAGFAAYVENGNYAAGSKVKNVGKRYECKEFPYSGWCNGAAWAYAPGTGAYWADAWYDRGTCTARTGETQEENNIESILLIVPNPASDVITINLNEASSVSIYNSQGIEVLSSTKVAAQGQVQLGQLSSGIYLVKVDTGFKVVTKTLVKN